MVRFGFPILLLLAFATLSVNANFNVTSLNTTLILNTNGSAHVVEALTLYISNSSIAQYQQDRQAINFTLTNWQAALNTNLLVEHILNSKSSVYGFTFLPGPVAYSGTSGNAQLTLSYFVNNVTSVKTIAPRKFLYTFNDAVFNFVHTASGQSLPQIGKMNIIVPKGSQIVSIYPVPDFPALSFISNYTGSTTFTWISQTPLSAFSFSYIITESPGQEVAAFFGTLYTNYSALLFLLVAIVLLALVAYLYLRVSNTQV
ncbi:MAG: hypothetical protein KGH53_01450 [Candidatus Micrarchaeota archaeon]|nr:hypothetical protein [Candidatus Micrarchaeota archaeon]